MLDDASKDDLQLRITALEGRIAELEQAAAEQSALEARLRRSQKIEAIVTLAGGIAHDFNNILFPIIGFTEIALSDMAEDDPRQSSLNEVLKAAGRAKTLVRQMLTFSRQSLQNLRPVGLADLVENMIKDLRPTIPTNIRIRLDLGSGEDVVLADPIEMEQVVLHLCVNASQAMASDGGTLWLRLNNTYVGPDHALSENALEPGRYVELTVTDTGPGMDQTVLERVFDPYFSTKPTGEGTGLGLALVYGIVKSCGGYVTVESRLGDGSRFRVWLPQIHLGVGAHLSEGGLPIPAGSEHILLVEHALPINQMIKGMLEQLGYRVTAVTQGDEALRRFRHDPHQFDAALVDWRPNGNCNGPLVSDILEINANFPVVVLTGFSDHFSRSETDALGVRARIVKPVVRNQLAETMRRVLDEKTI